MGAKDGIAGLRESVPSRANGAETLRSPQTARGYVTADVHQNTTPTLMEIQQFDLAEHAESANELKADKQLRERRSARRVTT